MRKLFFLLCLSLIGNLIASSAALANTQQNAEVCADLAEVLSQLRETVAFTGELTETDVEAALVDNDLADVDPNEVLGFMISQCGTLPLVADGELDEVNPAEDAPLTFALSTIFASTMVLKKDKPKKPTSAPQTTATSGGSTVCIHARRKLPEHQNGHSWVSLYDAGRGSAKEFHFGRYSGSQFQVRPSSYGTWKEKAARRDHYYRSKCVPITADKINDLLATVSAIREEGKPFKLTSHNCTTVASRIFNSGVSGLHRKSAIAPALLYNKL